MQAIDAPLRLVVHDAVLQAPWSGVARYASEVSERIAADSRVEARFFDGTRWSSRPRAAPLPASGRFWPLARRIPFARQLRRAWSGAQFGRGARGAAVYWEPNFLPLPFDGPTVTTIHDVSWLHDRSWQPAERVRALERGLVGAVQRSARILTDSEAVRSELLHAFSLPPERVTAIALAASARHRPHPIDATRATLDAASLRHGEYLLSVGVIEPRKNLLTTLRAFASRSGRERRSRPLVIAGDVGWGAESTLTAMAPLLAEGSVRRVGRVDDATLLHLTAGARALVYPSLYEGFGLPLVEAMACGVPVISSDRGATREVVGDGGLLIDPRDPIALSAAMARLDDDGERSRWAAAALRRARRFSWEATAARTLAVLHEAARRERGGAG
jgi:O-antigen biosynthesis alpha-1,3-rhamnosyltransferase